MTSDLVSLVDAAAILKVSAERVRQLVVAGDLPGVRIGNAWAVQRHMVEARRQAANQRGRPLSTSAAWKSIAALQVDLSNLSRYRNRGQLRRYQMSGADVASIASRDGVLVGGVAAAIGFGEALSPRHQEAHLYLSESLHGEVSTHVAMVPDQFGDVIMRVVPDGHWSRVVLLGESRHLEGRSLAPRGAVALDLMESGDPRHWVAAEHLVDGHG